MMKLSYVLTAGLLAASIHPAQTTTTRIVGTVRDGSGVGRYEVAVEAPGFKRYVQGPIPLEVEQTARVDVTMQFALKYLF